MSGDAARAHARPGADRPSDHRAQAGRRLATVLLAILGAVLGSFLLGACTGPPPACTANWVGPAGGDFHDASAWDTGVVPSAGSVACAPTGSSILVSDAQSLSSVRFAGTTTITATGSLVLDGAESSFTDIDLAGTIGGGASANVTNLSWTGGTLAGSGTTTVTGAATIGGAAVRLDDSRTLTLAGSTTVTAPAVEACGSSAIVVSGTSTISAPAVSITGAPCPVASAAHVALAPTGTLVVSGAATVERPLDNTGVVQVTGSGVLDLDGAFNQPGGRVDVADPGSTLRVAGGAGTFAPSDGSVTGTGTIAATWAGAATLAPGPAQPAGAIGALHITGNYAPVTGHLALDLAGPTEGTDYDQVVVGGAADVRTTAVVVALATGYHPSSSDTYAAVRSTGSLTRPLAGIDTPTGTGIGLHAVYTTTSLTLAVDQCDRSVYHPHASFMGATIGIDHGPKVSLQDCDLRGADFDGAVFIGVDFSGADLRGASFNGASFTSVSYAPVYFSGANLTGALVRNTNFVTLRTGMTCPDGTSSSANAAPNQFTCAGHTLSTNFTVSSAVDAVDAVPGDRICQTAVVGQCTLRAAVQEANAVPGPGLVILPAGMTATLSLAGTGEDLAATGDLDITDSLAVQGTATSTIDGGSLDRVFDVHGAIPVLFDLVKIRNGSSDGIVQGDTANLAFTGSVADSTGTGIVNGGNAYLAGSTVSGHAVGGLRNTGSAVVRSATFDGGATAITNTGRVTLKPSVTVKNAGTGLDNSGTATLTGATFDANTTGIAGSGDVTFTSGTITRSTVGLVGSGGATLNGATVSANQTGIDRTGPLTVSSSIVSTNTVTGIRAGGPLTLTSSIVDHNGRGVEAAGSVTMSRSTISNSTGDGPAPTGGLVLTATASTVAIDRSTIGQNGGTGLAVAGGAVTLTESTVGHNGTAEIDAPGGSVSSASSIVDAGGAHPACVGPAASYSSGDWNVASDTTCALTQAHDLTGVDPRLGRVGANGGTTTTMLPLLGSPAIDSGPPTCSGVDQRGSVRPVDGDGDTTAVCDRGAVETATYRPLDLAVNSSGTTTDANPGDGVCQTAVAGECTFPAAVTEANATFGPDTITLQEGATYGPTGSYVATPLRIVGNHAHVSTTLGNAVLIVTAPVDLVVSDLDDTTYSGAFLRVDDVNGLASLTRVNLNQQTIINAGILRLDRVGGGAIDNRGDLSMVDSSVSRGAVTTAAGATSRLERSTVSANPSTTAAAIVNQGTTTLIDSTVTANAGGGIQNLAGTVSASNSVIADQVGGPDCSGAVVSLGWNLASDGTCAFSDPTDLAAVPARLGSSLSWQGVAFRQPMTGSPVVDSGRPACSGVDIRGVPRPNDGDADGTTGCDRGAVELGSAHDLHLTVNDLADGRDARPGDGLCEAAQPGVCTLRAAVEEANATPGADEVVLAPQTYVLSSSLSYDALTTSGLPVYTSLSLRGNGATLSWNDYSGHPLFEVSGPQSVTVEDLTTSGRIHADEASLQLTRLTLAQGPIDSGGSLQLRDSTIGRTTSDAVIVSRGTATIDRLIAFGVIDIANTGSIVVQDSALHGRVDNRGHLELVRSSLDGGLSSSVASDPSGIAGVATLDPAATTIVRDTTISSFQTGVVASAGSTTVERSTIVDHRAVGVSAAGGSVVLSDSLVADAGLTDCAGPVGSGGRNIVSDGSCALTGVGDLNATDPLLGPAVHRGPHRVRYPTAGSPAIDSGDAACTATDELGTVRPVDGDADGTPGCDRGAVELGPVTPLTMVVDSADEAPDEAPGDGRCETATPVRCTLRAAVMEANATNGSDTITLAPTTYTVAVLGYPNVEDDEGIQGDLDLASPIVLHGNGATIDAEGHLGAFDVFGGRTAVAVDHLSITNATIAVRNRGLLDLTAVRVTSSNSMVVNTGQVDADHLVVQVSSGSTNSGTFNAVDSSISQNGFVNNGSVSLLRTSLHGGVTTSTATALLSIDTSTVSGGLVLAGSRVDIVDSTLFGWPILTDPAPGSTVTGSILEGGGPACSAPLTSLGWNIGRDASCGLTAPTDLPNTDPMLATWDALTIEALTSKPLPGSPAIDSGRPGCGGLDQRLLARPADGDNNGVAVCDRGAVERGRLQPLALAVNATTDGEDAHPGDGICETANPGECTFRAALTESNVSEGSDTVSLPAAATIVEDPALGRMTIANDVTVDGHGATLDGHLTSGLIRVIAPSHALITDLTITRSRPLDFYSTATILVLESASLDLTRVTLSSIEGTTILNRGQLSLHASRLEHNPTVWISPLDNSGTASIVDTTFDANATGIYNRGDLTVTSSTLSNTGSMGFALLAYNHSTTRLHTTTVSGNVGGGIYLYAGAYAWVYDSTITGNGDVGLWVEAAALLASQNSIVANHTWDCFGGAQILSGGYNLSSNNTCGFSAATDKRNVAANLGALADNGGPTWTHLPNVGSAALDTGNPTCAPIDQRGVARPRGAGCDRGAVER